MVNDSPDGVHALEDDEGLILLPTEDEFMLSNNEVIILNKTGTFYIFYDESDDDIDGWAEVQAVVNPLTPVVRVAPTAGAIFDNWKRFSGATTFNNAAEATGNAAAWEAVWAMDGETILQDKNGEDSLDSFTMPLNVDPASGFVTVSYTHLTLPTKA